MKKEADVELEWEYAPLGTQNLWIPVEDGISGQLDALQSQHILVCQSVSLILFFLALAYHVYYRSQFLYIVPAT